MKRHEAPALSTLYTPERTKIIDDFRRLKARKGWSDEVAARRINCSAGTVNRLLRCVYQTATVPDWVQAMARVIQREEKRREAPPETYVKTEVGNRVQEAIRIAQLERVITLVLGRSQVGKTMAAQAFCEANPDAIYILAGTLARPRALLQRIAAEAGVGAGGTTFTIRQAVAEALRDTDRVLIIDDADFMKEPTLQTLRVLHDEARVGLVLIGTMAFLQTLRDRRSATIEQVVERIAYHLRITEAPRADLKLIGGAYEVDREALAVLANHSAGSAGRCVRAIRAARRFNGDRLGRTAIEAAFGDLMPPLNGKD